MPLRLEVPQRSVSGVYTDNRWKHKYAFTVRHQNSVQIERFYREDDALKDRQHYIDLGYKDLSISDSNLGQEDTARAILRLDSICDRLVNHEYPHLAKVALAYVTALAQEMVEELISDPINDLCDELERVLSA